MINHTRASAGFKSLSLLAMSALLALGSACNKSDEPGIAAQNPPAPTTVGPGVEPVAPISPVDGAAPTLIRSDYAPGELVRLCDAAIAKAETKLVAIGQVPAAARSFDNTMLALELALAELTDETGPLTFMNYVSTSKAIRDESQECGDKQGAFSAGLFTRPELYAAIKDQSGRNADEVRLLSENKRWFEASGLRLPADKLAMVKALKEKLAKLQNDFSANLNNNVSTIVATDAELAGLPADTINAFEKNEAGKRVVPVNSSTYGLVMDQADVASTRRAMLDSWENRQADANTRLLDEAVRIRTQLASLLGYPTWFDAQTDGRMAMNRRTVETFLVGLRDRLKPRLDQDFAKLLAYKKSIEPAATKLDAWDIRWASAAVKERDYTLDDEAIRQYFPAEVVIEGMFGIYERLLGVKFTELVGAKVWHEQVKMYRITQSGGARDGQTIGYFYTDFFPRDNKYGHAAAFPLISARMLPSGQYSRPVAAIVSNLAAPTAGKPSLLRHDDVVTMFHEFGHIMHQTLTKAPYASLSGSATAQDFVEAPSQMLENWVFQPEILAMVSAKWDDATHMIDRSQKLPQDLREKIQAAANFNQGYLNSRQLVFGLFDLQIHSAKPNDVIDVTRAFADTHKAVMGIDVIEGSHFAASFGHMMGGYDAGYYGYLWSLVYAQDMFTRFDGHLLDSGIGGDYRRVILERGNMQDSIELLREFLGREPNDTAFLRKLGLGGN